MTRGPSINVSNLNKSKVPTSFPPLVIQRNKVNPICITNLITALDEVKARDSDHIDYDFYHKTVEQSIEAKAEYQQHLKVGEALLNLS